MITSFNDSTYLYRAVRPSSEYITEDGELTSAAFKESHGGVSVDCDGGRQKKECIVTLVRRFDYERGVASVTFDDCRSIGVLVRHMPEDDNEYHSEIHNNDEKVRLTQGQSRSLARAAIFELRCGEDLSALD